MWRIRPLLNCTRPTYLPTCLPAYLSTYLPTCLPAYLSTYLPTYLPTYLLVYLSPIYVSTDRTGETGEKVKFDSFPNEHG